MSFVNILSSFMTSHSLEITFTENKVFILMKSSLSIISFMDHAFDVVSKKTSTFSRISRFCPMLSSRSFLVLHFTFRFFTYFELIFWEVCKVCVKSHYLLVDVQLFKHHLLKTIFAPLYCLCSFVKDQFSVFIGVYFWALSSDSLMCLPFLSPVPHCLDYCSFIVSLKVGSVHHLCSSLSIMYWLFWFFCLSI